MIYKELRNGRAVRIVTEKKEEKEPEVETKDHGGLRRKR